MFLKIIIRLILFVCLVNANKNCKGFDSDKYPILNITEEDHPNSLKVTTKYEYENNVTIIHSVKAFTKIKIICTASYPIEIYFNYNWKTGCKQGKFEACSTISKGEYRNDLEMSNFVTFGSISCEDRNDSCRRTTLFPMNATKKEALEGKKTYQIRPSPEDKLDGYPSWKDRDDDNGDNCPLMLYYNNKTKNWICQSNGPEIYTFKVKWFRNGIEIKMLLDHFKPYRNCFKFWNPEMKECTTSDHCSITKTLARYEKTGHSQVFECVGDGVGAYTAIYYPLRKISGAPEFFYEWTQADRYSNSLIYIEDITPNNEELLIDQKIQPVCISHIYYFSFGTKWSVRYKNNTMISYEEEHVERGGNQDQDEYLYYKSTVEPVTLSSEMTEIICSAPISNSTKYVNSIMKINITKKSEHPQYIGNNINKTVEISSSQNSLVCKFFGKPIPIVKWSKDGIVESIKNDSITTLNYTQDNIVVSTLVFKSIKNKDAGTYTCEASNFKGTQLNTFFVQLKASNLTVILISTFALLVAVLLFGAFAYQWVQARKAKLALRALTDFEVDFFEFGDKSVPIDENDYIAIAANQPYNLDYEILKENLEKLKFMASTNENSILGTGSYGQVLKGQLKRCNGSSSSQIYSNTDLIVAVKTVKPSADIEYFKALLSEIKIMIFVGNGKNVVNLHGACTRNIKERDLFIVTEYCKNGSLDSFIEKNKKYFIDTFKGEKSSHNYENQMNKPNKYENEIQIIFNSDMLINWSRDISEGMEFLNSKKIVHCDLATRNVLLTDENVAKIGDFGLSRQLLENSNYKKSTHVPLPWRWMAIETLKELRFSHESDVWAYGVTLWEMFTLGQTPFANQRWEESFVKNLESGFRLFRPKHASNQIYNIMLDCWDEQPRNRPNFKQLKNLFQNIIESEK